MFAAVCYRQCSLSLDIIAATSLSRVLGTVGYICAAQTTVGYICAAQTVWTVGTTLYSTVLIIRHSCMFTQSGVCVYCVSLDCPGPEKMELTVLDGG